MVSTVFTGLISVCSGQLSTELGNETIILDLKSQVYYGLDGVGSRIWQLIQKPISFHAIRETLLNEFDVDETSCERDLIALLEDLRAKGLAEVSGGSPAP